MFTVFQKLIPSPSVSFVLKVSIKLLMIFQFASKITFSVISQVNPESALNFPSLVLNVSVFPLAVFVTLPDASRVSVFSKAQLTDGTLNPKPKLSLNFDTGA